MPSTGARLQVSSEDILVDAFKRRPADAIAYMKGKGNTLSWNWADTMKEAHAKSFTVAKVAKMDILQDIRTAVQESQRSGLPFSEFQKLIKPRLQAKGWWGEKVDPETGEIFQAGSPRRLETIYRVNNQTAYMTGRYKQMKEVADTFEYWQYISVNDSRTRPEHRALHKKVFRHDDPIWDVIYPPNGWMCRCRVRALMASQLEREGLQVTTGETIEKEVVLNGKTFNVKGVKVGSSELFPDAGWDYNPAKSVYGPELSKYDKDIAELYSKSSVEKGGLAKRIPIDSPYDIHFVIEQYANEHPSMFRHGFKDVKANSFFSDFASTNGKGTISMNTFTWDEYDGWSPAYDFQAALGKIAAKKPLTFNQEYSVESMWHEIMHNRAVGSARVLTSYELNVMEMMNQWAARRTYPRFLRDLGTRPRHYQEILSSGYGYPNLVSAFDRILNTLSIDGNKALKPVERILFNTPYEKLDTPLRELLENLSQKKLNETAYWNVLGNLNAGREDAFQTLLDKLIGR